MPRANFEKGTKVCSKCGEEKPLDNFYNKKIMGMDYLVGVRAVLILKIETTIMNLKIKIDNAKNIENVISLILSLGKRKMSIVRKIGKNITGMTQKL